ncbi:MAG: two-component system response regulator CreB [Methylococcales bacterium]|jgi:two-component system, OmpR family, catabolic regulation response regulator CreB|nr:two-component system response regulator CreB [Methylococcales bacterium]
MKQILIVEDDIVIAETIGYALEKNSFAVANVSTGEGALSHLQNNKMDLVLLDIGLPDMNGFEVLKSIRQTSEIPVIFITARDDEIDKVLGLELGADDYVTKPLSPRELVARVNANLKRVTQSSVPASKPLSLFDINEKYMQITFDGTELSLTKAEYNLLAYLIHRPKQVFSRDQLLTAIWNESYLADERTIDTHIKSLRAKLKVVNSGQETIKTHRGLGYSLSM